MRDFLRAQLAGIGLTATERQLEQFLLYYNMVVEQNKVMNLTAITEYNEFVVKHFCDSLMINSVVDLGCKSLVDLGTGAGFPGIVLKIMFPDLKITLIDSLNKRINFLNRVIEKLDLKNIVAVHGRAEDCGRSPLYREQFDICVSRAVSNLSTLSEYCLPFVKVNGLFISYKSANIDEELESAQNAIEKLSAKVIDKHIFILPGTDMKRCLIAIKKLAPTDKKYPRKAGIPNREPL